MAGKIVVPLYLAYIRGEKIRIQLKKGKKSNQQVCILSIGSGNKTTLGIQKEKKTQFHFYCIHKWTGALHNLFKIASKNGIYNPCIYFKLYFLEFCVI